MKKLAVLALVIAALLGMTCLAETDAAVVRLDDLALAYADAGGVRSVRFEGAGIMLAVGEPDGDMTLQASVHNGNGQMMDALLKIVGQEVLLSMGGLSATYAVDLQAFAGEGNSAEDTARGLTRALQLAGSHLDVVLYAATRDDGNGMRSVEVPLPMPQLISMAEALLSAAEDPNQDDEMDSLYSQVDALNGEARLGFRYSPENGAFELAAMQGGRGMRLSGTMHMANEQMTFISIADEEERLDALHLDDEQKARLREELGILLSKFTGFADASGLNGIMP